MRYGNPDISLDINFSLSPIQTQDKPLLTLNIGSSQKPLHPKAKSVIQDILENGQYQINCQDSGQNLAVDILETEDENAELEKLRAQTKQLQNQNAELVQANQEFQVKYQEITAQNNDLENENKVLSEQNADLATQCEQLAKALPEPQLTEEDAHAAEEIQLLQDENIKQNNRIQAFIRVMHNKGIYDEISLDEVEYQENLFAHLNAVVDKLAAEFQNLQVIKSGRQSVIIRPDQKLSEDNISKMLTGLKSFLVEQKPLAQEIIRTNGKVINNNKTLQEGANLGFFNPNDVTNNQPENPFPDLPKPKPLEPYRSIIVAPDFPPSPFATNEQTSNSDDPNDLPFPPLPQLEDPVTEPFPVDPNTALPFPETEKDVESFDGNTQVFRVTDLLKDKK